MSTTPSTRDFSIGALEERLQSRLSEINGSVPLDSLSTEALLDLPAGLCRRAREAASRAAPSLQALHSVRFRPATGYGRSSANALIRFQSGRAPGTRVLDGIHRVLSDVCAERFQAIMLVGDIHVDGDVPDGAVVLHGLPAGEYSERVRISRYSVSSLPEERIAEYPAEDLIKVQGQPVACKGFDGSFLLLVQPFVRDGAFSAARPENLAKSLDLILGAIGEQVDDGDEQLDPDLIEAVATTDMVLPLVGELARSLTPEIERARERLQTLEQDIERKRAAFMTALRERQEATAELAQLESGGEGLGAELLQRALVEVQRIRRNPCVRSVSTFSEGAQVRLAIDLYPLVIKHDGERYLLDKLSFSIGLTGNDLHPKWAEADPSPHPHVDPDIGNTCWGEADQPIREALDRQDYAAAVTFICGWARIYNERSPYYEIHRFPKTDLPEGWQTEGAS